MRLITCKELSVIASQRQERALTLRERLALRIHLVVCEGCRRAARQLEFIRRAMKQLADRDDRPR